MEGARIALALTNIDESNKLKTFLTASGFTICDQSSDGASAIRRIRALKPDIVICDYDLPVMSGGQLARILDEDMIAPIVMITGIGQSSGWRKGARELEYAHIQRPITKSALLQTINLVFINYKKIIRLQSEIVTLKNKLDNRKIIEKAKGILMYKLDISEDEAYKKLQKQSMDKGISMKQVANALIVTSDMDI